MSSVQEGAKAGVGFQGEAEWLVRATGSVGTSSVGGLEQGGHGGGVAGHLGLGRDDPIGGLAVDVAARRMEQDMQDLVDLAVVRTRPG